MADASKADISRSAGPLRRFVLVESVQLGYAEAMITMRISDESRKDPVAIVIPGETAAAIHEQLREAATDAEETYWDTVHPWLEAIAEKRENDTDAMFQDIQHWHQQQGWDDVARRTSLRLGGHPMGLLSHAGHVAILAAPPVCRVPILAIFDPTQVRRIDEGLSKCVRGATSQPMLKPWTARADAVLHKVHTDPWLEPGTVPEVSATTASQRQKAIYEEFLRRSPYVRPDEHNVGLDDN